MLKVPAEIWAYLRDLAGVASPCRMSLLIVLAGFFLLASPQGQELTVRLPSESFGKVVWFNICVFLWAFQSWYWSRLVLDVTFGPQRAADVDHPRRERIHRLVVRLPRAIAIAAYAIAIGSCLLTGRAAWLITLFLFLEGALFIVFLVYRGWVLRRLAAGPRMSRLFVERGADSASLWSLPLFSRILIGATFVAEVGLMAWACMDAVSFGWTFGAAAVPFLGFSMLIPVGSLLILLAREGGTRRLAAETPDHPEKGRGYPILWILLLLAIGFSLVPAFDNHKVRTAPGVAIPGTPLDRALSQWYRQAPPSAVDGRRNMVVVAAAGGGLRAAYWTATMLATADDQTCGAFGRHVYAYSGVSGGSLGISAYLAQRQVWEAKPPAERCRPGRKDEIVELLRRDFLAPVAGSLLFAEMTQRFVPFDYLEDDRGSVLAKAWSRAWDEVFPKDKGRFDRPFLEVFAAKSNSAMPAVFLNATAVESGRRAIASNIQVWLPDGIDLFRPVRGVALKTSGLTLREAVLNSARFTYVSPAGTVYGCAKPNPDGTCSVPAKLWDRLVDGGYFENSGATATLEILKTLPLLAREDARWAKVEPIVIHISNEPLDPSAGPATLAGARENESLKPHGWLNEVMSPLWAMLNARGARGVYARDALNWHVGDAGFLRFGLCRLSANIPLGWVLSQSTRDRMEKQLARLEAPAGQPACEFDNAGNLEAIERRLASLKPRAISR